MRRKLTESDRNEGGLKERQLKAIPHLVASSTYEKGCHEAGISRDTLYEWLKDPAFKAELRAQRDRVLEGALDILKGHIGGAVEALVDLLPTKNEYLRRTVANDIIEHVLKGRELEDLEKRITSLEKIVSEQKKRGIMKEFHRRLQKLENQVGNDKKIVRARALVSFGKEVGLIGPNEDTEKLVADFASQGASLAAILKEIDGTSLGPPSQRMAAKQA